MALACRPIQGSLSFLLLSLLGLDIRKNLGLNINLPVYIDQQSDMKKFTNRDGT